MRSTSVKSQRADGIKSRETILQAAARLATVEGLAGLSIGMLAEHIGMSKSGLYAHFGSKEELQLATVDTAREIFEALVIDPTLEIEDPIARVKAVSELYLDHLARRVFPGGCFFIAVAAEFDTHPGSVQSSIREFLDTWTGLFVELLNQAQAQGKIVAHEDTKQLAFEIDSYLVLANLSFVLYGQEQVLDRARKAVDSRLAIAQGQ